MSSNKVLLHACCAPCLTNSIKELENEGFLVTVYFFNPNIYPPREYQKRLEELMDFSNQQNYPLIIEKEGFADWDKLCSEFSSEKEGGKRCEKCFEIRLEKTADFAKKNDFDYFCTTLTISPHKNSKIINQIGNEISQKYNINFLEKDFKKNNGFKKSLEISKEFGLFRQNYCGCKYSIRAKID